MTENEILIALVCCKEETKDCRNCPLLDRSECRTVLAQKCYTLFNRLHRQAENYKQIAAYQQRLSMERYFDIKRLEKGNQNSVRVFAEKLKQGLPTWLHPYIDLIEKEMAGEE